ncbi:MAG: hypothetical protein HPY51_03810 [Candidatus Omnitrophica bacterium]|nr:hypothetical protein [Candidatus Omnitrophota bacterium]
MVKNFFILFAACITPLLMILAKINAYTFIFPIVQTMLVVSALILAIVFTVQALAPRLLNKFSITASLAILLFVILNQIPILIVLLLISAFAYHIAQMNDERIPFVQNSVLAILLCQSGILLAVIFLYPVWEMQKAKLNLSFHDELTVDFQSGEKPDIYYIILDGYAREDILKDYYQVTDTPLYQYLKDNLFFVADRSHANYAQTSLSLASSLNYDYIPNLFERIDPSHPSRLSLHRMISQNRIMKILRQNGYHILTFHTGYHLTEIPSAGHYLHKKFVIHEFQKTFIGILTRTSMFKDFFYDDHRNNILYTLSALKTTSSLPSPRFVFAHIICPHSPFVLSKKDGHIYPSYYYSIIDGCHLIKNNTSRSWYIQNYAQQLLYIDDLVIDTLTHILKHSRMPLIIVLQSDHGPASTFTWEKMTMDGARERMSILNALYCSDKELPFYRSITPVNTFRIILNHFTNANLKLLEDQCYFSSWDTPFDFYKVPEEYLQ